MDYSALVLKLSRREDLSSDEAAALARALLNEATDGQIAAALTAMQMKGPTADELAGFARQLRSESVSVESPVTNHVDTCGTGGGVSSFNISTAAAIIAAGAGAVVAKHGNRAVTGRFGSADVLEAIQVPLCENAPDATRRLKQFGFAFLFAPHFQPAVARVAKVRRELPFRTLFNALGPLLNPAGAARQIIGVYDPALLMLVANALVRLGTERAVVVHGEPGLDEVSPVAITQAALVENGEVRREEWTPATFGARAVGLDALLAADSSAQNGEILIESVTQIESNRCLAVLPSAAVAICLAGLAGSWQDGYELARESVRSGRSAAKLAQLRSDS